MLLALASCARDTPPDPELTKGALPNPVPGQFASKADAGAVVDGWLASFNDPTLTAMVAEGLEHNRDLAASRARLDQAAAQARQAGAALKPQVGYSVDASTAGNAAGGANTDKMGAGLTLSWELDVWGRLSAAQQATQEAFASQAADLEFARQSLAAQIAKGWFLCIQSLQQEQIATEFAGLQTRNVELTQLREANGRATAYDVALARSTQATALDSVRNAQSGRERAVRSLELLLGRYPRAELTLTATLPTLAGPPPAGMPSQLLERRPDLIAATRKVAAAFNQVESAKAARLPRLSISAEVGGSSQSLRNLSADDVFWNLAGNLMGPIYDGGRLKEQVAIETAKQAEALAQFGSTALNAFREVEESLSEEVRLADRLTLTETAASEQGKAEHLAKLRFDAGAIDQLALILVQGQALNARLAALAMRVERLTNRVNLHLALGGGFAAPPPTPEDAAPASKVVPATAPVR
jgi:NodT family efflux transporter outer membrane factor (OMF) lipoprotein